MTKTKTLLTLLPYYEVSKRNSKYVKTLRGNATLAEKRMQGILDELDLRYMFQKGFFASGFHCIVDFYIPKPYKLCIEINGSAHDDSSARYRDAAKERYLVNKRGFNFLSVTNEEVFSGEAEHKLKYVLGRE